DRHRHHAVTLCLRRPAAAAFGWRALFFADISPSALMFDFEALASDVALDGTAANVFPSAVPVHAFPTIAWRRLAQPLLQLDDIGFERAHARRQRLTLRLRVR